MYEMLVGLAVKDDHLYNQYRIAMKPILSQYGGDFGYDLTVADMLKSQVDAPMNRVFTINFPCEAQCNDFFTDEEYFKVKQEYFDRSVESITIMATYTK